MTVNISKILAKAKAHYDNIVTQMIESDEIGSQVTIFYPVTKATSSVCQFSEWGGSSINGNPAPAIDGSCPACGGDCQKEVQTTAIIRARLYSSDPSGFSPSLLRQFGLSGSYPDYQMLMIFKATDYEKVKNAAKAQFYSDLESTVGKKFYELVSDIRPHGFGKDKFMFCFWKKV